MYKYLEKRFNVVDGVKSFIWKFKQYQLNELEEENTGIHIFCGPQGSGKSLSMIHYAKQIIKDHPKAIIVTNIDLQFDITNEVIKYSGFEDFKIENGIYGVIYILDEIHLILNSLESKGTPLSVIVELSQQRKQRKLILGTSQVYGRMAKPLREQIKSCIICKNYFKVFQFNYLINAFETEEGSDGKLKFKKLKASFFFHSKEDYNNYDTYKKMDLYVGIAANTNNYN